MIDGPHPPAYLPTYPGHMCFSRTAFAFHSQMLESSQLTSLLLSQKSGASPRLVSGASTSIYHQTLLHQRNASESVPGLHHSSLTHRQSVFSDPPPSHRLLRRDLETPTSERSVQSHERTTKGRQEAAVEQSSVPRTARDDGAYE